MPRSTAALAATLTLASALFARPSSAASTARLVARVGAEGPYSTEPVQARVGERVEVLPVLVDARGRVFTDAPSLRWRGRVRAPDGPLPAGTRVEWRGVTPRMEHTSTPSPNAGIRTYSNAVLFGPRHGRWIGYDRIEYESFALADAPDGSLALAPDARSLRVTAGPALAPEVNPSNTQHGAGSRWFTATLTLADGTHASAPDDAQTDRYGLSLDVLRVSFRAGDDFSGWLGTYFGVPYVFGSNGTTAATHQTDRYTGADCADVLVGARRAAGDRSLAYTSVAGIGAYADAVTGVLFVEPDGSVHDARGAAVSLRWGTDVRAGDLVAMDFADDATNALPRAWDHIGALLADRGTAGVFDGADLLRHAADEGLRDAPLRSLGRLRVVLWRWRR